MTSVTYRSAFLRVSVKIQGSFGDRGIFFFCSGLESTAPELEEVTKNKRPSFRAVFHHGKRRLEKPHPRTEALLLPRSPFLFLGKAPDTASNAHPRRSRSRKLRHQPCTGRHGGIYSCKSLADSGVKIAYLCPRPSYAAAADRMICAVATLPTPRSREAGG